MIKCEICGVETHSIQLHLRDAHPGTSLESYQQTYPGAPLLSKQAEEKLAKSVPSTPIAFNHASTMSNVTPIKANAPQIIKKPMNEVFGLPDTAALRSSRGTPIEVSVYTPHPDFAQFVPPVDKGHVWDPEDLKNMMMAIEMNMPLYAYGHKGTGKTTDIEQICACTGRPLMRVQHTINTEESHILGQRVIDKGETPFELGPLPLAMKWGLVYLADEYDFALASVLSVYQPVLEGNPLFIKEAAIADRIVRPSEHFRFVATGNTNGSGDDSGLYAGTSIQNSANYDRFTMMIEKKYMAEDAETKIVQNRTGMSEVQSRKLVKFASSVRQQFEAKKLSDTISTRALIAIGKIGLRRNDMKLGIKLCFSNKLNPVDRATIDGVAQREYGN
jgi:cobaltochelatase CobS